MLDFTYNYETKGVEKAFCVSKVKPIKVFIKTPKSKDNFPVLKVLVLKAMLFFSERINQVEWKCECKFKHCCYHISALFYFPLRFQSFLDLSYSNFPAFSFDIFQETIRP